MKLSHLLLGFLACSTLLSLTFGQTNDLDLIRKEMQQLRQDYEQRLRVLEERLQRLAVTNQPLPEIAPQKGRPGEKTPPVSADQIPHAQETNAVSASSENTRTGYRTESRQLAIASRQDTLFRERVEQVLEGFVDITGYFRAGYGGDGLGGPQVAFQAPGAFSKYRLGNETEIYGELGFGKNFYLPNLFSSKADKLTSTSVTGPVARVQLLLSAYNPYQDLLTASGTDFGLPEAWASIANVVPSQPSINFWAGARYYRRHDIHISDFFFYNMSGVGGGAEDIQLPFGKAAVAWIGSASSSGFSDLPQPDAENEAGFSKDNLDFRLYDVPVPLGKGEFGLVLARSDSGKDADGNSVPKADGFSVAALHTRDKFLSSDGFNKFSLQFGTGPAKTFTSGYETVSLTNGVFIQPDAQDSWRFRATEHFVANLGSHFSISPACAYQYTDNGDNGGIQQWVSAGVRPVWHFNRFLSLAFEGGVDWVKDNDTGSQGYLTKLTLAPQVSLGGRFLSRPVIRAFITRAFWSEDFVGYVGGNNYSDRDNGWSYGVQMEAWW